jgi:hypothetical protein
MAANASLILLHVRCSPLCAIRWLDWPFCMPLLVLPSSHIQISSRTMQNRGAEGQSLALHAFSHRVRCVVAASRLFFLSYMSQIATFSFRPPHWPTA